MFKFLIILLILVLSGLFEVECFAFKQLKGKYSNQQKTEVNQLRTKLELKPNQVALAEDVRKGYYIGNFSVGTPPQQMKLSFDAGFSYTWLLSSKCESLWSEYHEFHYNNSKSTTYESNGTKVTLIWGGFFTLKSEIDRDNFQFLGNSTLKQFEFLELLEIDYALLEKEYLDGVIGLGFNNEQGTFVESLYRQNLIEKPMISFYYNNDPNGKESYGIATFGSIDEQYIVGDLIYVPVLTLNQSIDSWNFIIEGMHAVDDNRTLASACLDNCTVTFDTSDSVFFMGPKDMVEAINLGLGAHWNPWGFYEIDCGLDGLMDLKITIGNHNFTLAPEQYVVGMSGSCGSALQPLDPDDGEIYPTDWVISWSIMVEFYTVFDYEKRQIGFADTPRLH